MAFIVLSLVTVAVGWMLVQIDDQYESSSVVGRALVGIFGGALGALIVSPINALISAIIGVLAAAYHRKQMHLVE